MNLEEEIKNKSAELDDTPLEFGKYKGKTPDYISDYDPGYIVWLWENTTVAHCSKALYEFCLKELEED